MDSRQILPGYTNETAQQAAEAVVDSEEAEVSAEECADRVLESNRITNFLRLSLEAKEDIPLCIALLMENWKGPGSVYQYIGNQDFLWFGDFEATFNGRWRVEDLENHVPNAAYGSCLEALQTSVVIERDFK